MHNTHQFQTTTNVYLAPAWFELFKSSKNHLKLSFGIANPAQQKADSYLTPVGSPSPTIEPIYRMNDNGFVPEIAKGFEINETVTGEGETISWTELCAVILSIKQAGTSNNVRLSGKT